MENQILNQDQRIHLVKQIRQWGDLNTDALLDLSTQSFTAPGIDGFIGYRMELNCAVVFGDPVCPSGEKQRLSEAFRQHCKEKELNVVYVIVSDQFANSSLNEDKKILLQFGNKLILEPSDNPINRSGQKGGLVRKKVKHALKDGVVINEYQDQNPALEKEIEQIGRRWLESRHGPQVYIAHLDFFHDREGKRWFYATHEGRLVGFLILNQTQATSGWLLNNLIITRDAPSGTSELLITKTLEVLESENCNYVMVGPVTANSMDHIIGLNPFFAWLIKLAFRAAKKIFRLDGQMVFWEKFQAKHEPSYVMFDKINLRTVQALLKAMNVSF